MRSDFQWCFNKIRLADGDKDISAVFDDVLVNCPEKTVLDFMTIAPRPSNERANPWWCQANWGCDGVVLDLSVEEDLLRRGLIVFDTHSSPAVPATISLAKLTARGLQLYYLNTNADFCGELHAWPNGSYVHSHYQPLKTAPARLLDEVSWELEDDEEGAP